MCQEISGPQENLEERFAYKVVGIWGTRNYKGLYYPTHWNKKTGWSNSSLPHKFSYGGVVSNGNFFTTAGYHVLKTKAGATAYMKYSIKWVGGKQKVIKVKIKGKALPFKFNSYQGYAVQYWRELT